MARRSDIDVLIDKAQEAFFSSIDSIENKFLKALFEYLTNNYSSGGVIKKISGRELQRAILNVSKALKRELKKAGFEKSVRKYLSTFGEIDELTARLHATVNGISKPLLESIFAADPAKKLFVEATERSLLGSGISEGYLEGIKNVLARFISQGISLKEAEEELKSYIKRGNRSSRLERYSDQVGRDTLNQYEGNIQNSIKKEFDLVAFNYRPLTDIRTTRPFCDHLTDLERSKPFLVESDLVEALNEFCPDGIPSQESITYTTARNTTTKKKGSGMIDGTVLDNVIVNRGGFNCRHRLYPVAITKAEKERIKQANKDFKENN